jgi:mannose-6-phosphate isomerase-like protein (cupin superfamily)
MAAKGEEMTHDTAHRPALEPVAVPVEHGEARWWGDGLAEIKATASDTGGQMTILEITEPPDKAAPLHVHHTEDEGFWILDGSATFEVGHKVIEVRAGDYLFGRGTYRTGTRPGPRAAGCCSSSPPAASRSCSLRSAAPRRAARCRHRAKRCLRPPTRNWSTSRR